MSFIILATSLTEPLPWSNACVAIASIAAGAFVMYQFINRM